jgi:hypothetical protein
MLAALDLDASDPRDAGTKRDAKAEIIATYPYLDEEGTLLYRQERIEPGKDGRKKEFRLSRPDGERGWIYDLDGVRRVPYRARELTRAIANGELLYIVEGEKCVESLVAQGLVATTFVSGASGWREEYAEWFVDADVAILPDNDDPGRRYANAIQRDLVATARHVRVVELPGLGEHEDIIEWLDAGHTVKELTELVSAAEDENETDDGLGVVDGADLMPDRSHATTDEAPDVVLSTGELLDAVKAELERFVVFADDSQAIAVAAWVLHTHVFEAFDTTPYLHVSSPTKQSGKSRLFEVLALLAARAWLVIEASEAALFRTIEKKAPTLLLDEIDAAFGKDAEMMHGIRGILNAGYRKGATVPRCVGNSFEVVDFAVYCPKAFAGIGNKLPDTIVDRSIPIMLRRRSPIERRPERFRQARATADLAPLAVRLRSWGKAHTKSIGAVEADLPDGLSDRQQDAWEPLFAIAVLAGGDWPERVERAALTLHEAAEDGDLTMQLLAHAREAFDDLGDRLSSKRLLEHLVNRGDASPWVRWWGEDVERGDARLKTAAQSLARMLHPMGISPVKIRFSANETRQGYRRSDFEDAWSRYLVPTNKVGTSEHTCPRALSVSRSTESQRASDLRSSDVPTLKPEGPELDGWEGRLFEPSRPVETVPRPQRADLEQRARRDAQDGRASLPSGVPEDHSGLDDRATSSNRRVGI